MQKDKVPVHCADASVDEGQEAGNTGGAAVCACTTGPLERIANALEELVRATKEKENLPPTPPNREIETNKNNKKTRTRVRVFIKPTVEEVAAYKAEKGYTFDAEEFWSYYESNGWHVGRNPMKSWKSACIIWQKNRERDMSRRVGGRRKADNNVEMTEDVREEVRRDFAL